MQNKCFTSFGYSLPKIVVSPNCPSCKYNLHYLFCVCLPRANKRQLFSVVFVNKFRDSGWKNWLFYYSEKFYEFYFDKILWLFHYDRKICDCFIIIEKSMSASLYQKKNLWLLHYDRTNLWLLHYDRKNLWLLHYDRKNLWLLHYIRKKSVTVSLR